MTIYKVYKLFNDNMDLVYYGITKLKIDLCINLLKSYKTRYENDDTKPKYSYFELFVNDGVKHEIIKEYDNRKDAKDYINELSKTIPIKTALQTLSNKTNNLQEYNKKKYIENKVMFQEYYEQNKTIIRERQKQRYEIIKAKLKLLDEINKI